MLALFAAPALADDCKLTMVNSVPLTMVSNGRVVLAPVAINGVAENLLVDTGGAFTQLSIDTIRDIKLPVEDSGVKMLDLYGSAAEWAVRIDTFGLGRLRPVAFLD